MCMMAYDDRILCSAVLHVICFILASSSMGCLLFSRLLKDFDFTLALQPSESYFRLDIPTPQAQSEIGRNSPGITFEVPIPLLSTQVELQVQSPWRPPVKLPMVTRWLLDLCVVSR